MAVYYEEERKKGGFWGKFLAVILGFLFGILCTLGGLAGLGYVIYAKIKIEDGISTVGKVTGGNIDYKEYITDEYAQKTIAELVKDLTSLASGFQNGTGSLQSLANISPQVQKAAEKIVSALADYGVPMETSALMNTALSEMGAFFQDSLKSAEVGTLLKKANALEESSKNYALLMQICYGEEGIDYTVVEGEVQMRGDSKPATVGDLMDSPDNLLDKVDLAVLMETTGSLDKSDPTIRALLYGTEGKNYEYDEEANKVVMLPLAYDFDAATNKFTAGDGVVYAYDEKEERWVNEKNGGYIAAVSGAAAAAVQETSPSYAYYVCTKEGKIIYSLALKEENTYHAYDKDDVLQYNKSLSLKELMDVMGGSGDREIKDLFADVQLGDLLNVTPDSDAVLIALAYGTEGVDYMIENDRIVPLEGRKPTTIGTLTAEGGTDELFDKIELGSALGVSPLDENPDQLMVALAFGNEGRHYRLVTNPETGLSELEWQVKDETTGEKYAPRTIGDLKKGSAIIEDVYLSTALKIDGKSDEIMRALAFGNEGEDYTLDENGAIQMLPGRTPRTIKDLQNGNLVKEIRLSAVLKAKPTDKITMYLLYGVENTHYSYDETTGVVTMLGRQIAVCNGFAYDERGDRLPGTLAEVEGGYTYTENTGTADEIVFYLKDKSGASIAVGTETGTQTAEFYYATDAQGASVFYEARTIGDLTGESTLFSDITKDLALGDLIEIKDTDPMLLHSLKGTKIDELGDAVDKLTLAEILGEADVESNTILKHLKSSTVSTLAADINKLTIQEVFADDVYKKDDTKSYFIDKDGNRLYENPDDGKFYTSEDFTVEARRVLTGTWKYLLTDRVSHKEKAYTITQMNELVLNMTSNIQAASLNDLYADGVINLEKTDFLTSSITYEFTYNFAGISQTIGEVATKYYDEDGTLKTLVGELTITEILNYVGEVVRIFARS